MRQAIHDHLFECAIGASVLLHGLFFGSAALLGRWRLSALPSVEVDLTMNLTPRAPWDLRAPGASRGAPAPAPKPHPGPAAPPPAPKQKEWVLPGPKTQQLEKLPPAPPPAIAPAPGAAPGGTGTGGEGGNGGSGGGKGTGEAIGNRGPRLLNAAEIGELLRSSYPAPERAAGREAQVVVGISIGVDGSVLGVDVLQSAGALFDEAAKNVASKMRFEPALIRSVPSAVKVRQVIAFRLTD